MTLSYFHPLLFERGNYVLRLHTTLPALAVAMDASPNSLVEVGVTLNTGAWAGGREGEQGQQGQQGCSEAGE